MLESSSHTFLFSCSLADDYSHLYNADHSFSNIRTQGCNGVYSHLAGWARETRSFRLEVLQLCCTDKWSVLYHQSDGAGGSSVSRCDPLRRVLHTTSCALSLCLGYPAAAGSQPPAHLHLSSVFRVAAFLLKYRVRRTFCVLGYTGSCWFLSSLFCWSEAELLNYSDHWITCSVLTVSLSVILHKVLPLVNTISCHVLAAISSQNEITYGWQELTFLSLKVKHWKQIKLLSFSSSVVLKEPFLGFPQTLCAAGGARQLVLKT